MQIANDSVVSIDYELKNDAGEVLDASAEGSPLVYLHGHRNLISGLEQALEGKTTGESLEVRIAPADAYGEVNESLRQSVPKDRFQGVEQLEVGMQFQASTDKGPISVRIVAVEEELVTVDGNHPLAGEHLNFNVTVRDVRAAEESEIAHGHVHGKGGVEH
jgi:FKBP-type peptidyl-prolyl cis-trans isomerase SlyD